MDVDPLPKTNPPAEAAPGPGAAALPKPRRQPNASLLAGIPEKAILNEKMNPTQTLSQPFAGPQAPVRRLSPHQVPPGMKGARMIVEDGLIDLMSLQRERYGLGMRQAEDRFRLQCSVVMDDLRVLREELSYVIRGAESHRWRKWLVGGLMAGLIPAIRAIWRRPGDDKESSNDTEYAFRKSRSLIGRVLDLRHGFGRLASFTFFVFAAVYVFQNEVTLRVAKTVSKRLGRLSVKLERGDLEITEEDLRLVRGWRWRILA